MFVCRFFELEAPIVLFVYCFFELDAPIDLFVYCFFELEAPIDLFEYVFLIGELQYHDCAEVHIFIIDPNSNIMEEITEDISDKSMQSRS